MAPGGQLFTLAVLTIAAHFGGWLMLKVTTLPALIGMLIVGVALKNVGFVNFDKDYMKVGSYIRYVKRFTFLIWGDHVLLLMKTYKIYLLFIDVLVRTRIYYLIHSFYCRKIALTIILTRAGLDLDPHAMKKYFLTVIKLALIPWTFECVLCAVLSHFFLQLPWDWGKHFSV